MTEVRDNLREALIEIVPPGNIAYNSTVLDEYSKDCSFLEANRPLMIVRPENKVEVKKIIELANEIKVPLVPVSSGGPHFNGDTVPSQSSIVMDLKGMNHIFKVDEVNRSVWIEPGVMFKQLLPEARKHGLKLNMPLLPRGSKSVLTACLEREPPLIPKYQFDNVDPLLTLEVIYGTGDEFRTGSASGPGDLDHLKSDKVNPWGPGPADYHRFLSDAQGTMGIVTWAVIKAEILPSIQKFFFIPSSDPGKAVALINALIRKRVIDECLILNNVNLAAILAEDPGYEYEELRDNLPPWTTIVCISGYKRRADERVEIQEKYLKQICDKLALKPNVQLPEAKGKEKNIPELLSNCYTDEPYWKLRVKGSCHSIFFLSPMSRVGEYPLLMSDIALKHSHHISDIGCYIQPIVQGRGCHCEFNLFCDDSITKEATAVQELFLDASSIFMKSGAFFSRPYAQWAEMVYSQYPEEVAALRKLKGIFDPNNILNPGKLCF
jgi:FAD/FMN-containing dehydrogenase